MAAPWTPDERDVVEGAIKQYPVPSGKCAALARVVFAVGQTRDETTRGRQVRPAEKLRARWIIPKHSAVRAWASHTFVETHQHAVDALAGADGCEPAQYLQDHFKYAELLDVVDVDVATVDPGIEDEQ